MRSVALLTAVLLTAAGAVRCGGGPPAEAPDVLVLVMDTTRADRCSFLGYERPTTPRLAEFARDAVVFTEAWSPGSWTFPAHAALFTGLRPESLGLRGDATSVLPASATTLAEILTDAGWATGCFTSNAWLASHAGTIQGFGTYVPVFAPPRRETAREGHDAALEFMRSSRRAGRRFFAFVNDVEPHAPWTPSEEDARRFTRAGLRPAAVTEARSLRFPRTALAFAGREHVADDVRAAASDLYDAEIAGLDAEIGRLLDTMRSEGLLDRTLVVITSDHGEGLGDHGWMEHGVLVHREILRVPLLVRPPGGCPPRTVRDVVRLHDVFATVLDACGLPQPRDTDSLPLLGDTSGRVARAEERTREDLCLVIEQLTTPGETERFRRRRRSWFDGALHLIVDDAGGVELYDVAADPGERSNVASSRPTDVARLRALLDAR